MDRIVLFHPSFSSDISDAVIWYEARSYGLGVEFQAAVRDCVDSILADPESHSRIDEHLRYRQVKRFPYLVLFECDSHRLLMYAVMHAAKSPQQWNERRT
jgi:hypothetical protein